VAKKPLSEKFKILIVRRSLAADIIQNSKLKFSRIHYLLPPASCLIFTDNYISLTSAVLFKQPLRFLETTQVLFSNKERYIKRSVNKKYLKVFGQ
jgi:hypothetical protein